MRRFIPLFTFPFMAVTLLSVLFKIMHWEGADTMLILALGNLVFLIPIYFIGKMKDAKSTLGKISYLLFIPSLCPTILGILFKLMNWSGGDTMLIVGFASFIFPTLIVYVFFQLRKSENNFTENFVGFFSILLFLLLVITFFNKSKPEIVNSFESLNMSMMNSARNMLYNNNLMIENTPNLINKSKLNDIHTIILQNNELLDSLKNEIIEKSGFNQSNQPSDLSKLNIGNEILLKNGTVLFNNLNTINDKLDELNPNISTKITSIYFNQMKISNINEWIYKRFNQQPVTENLAMLSSIQNDILTAENEVLISIKNK